MEPPHLTGQDLSRRYYHELVWPLIASRWPDLPHAAGRLGQGSDVLGLDDAMSRDHDWGLRLTMLVEPEMIMPVRDHLDAHLPDTFLGHPTRFAYSGATEPINHVDVWSPAGFAIDRLGIDPREGLTTYDWLALTGQTILEVTAGPIFTDTTGEISAIRQLLTWYPDDIWRYLVATAWVRLDEEMPLMSRAGFRGDDLGSRLIAARMVAVIVHLAFLIERRWTPYSKWRGTLFGTLACAPTLRPHLESALSAPTWEARQEAICAALDVILRAQRRAGLPASEPATVPFWDRPFRLPNPEIEQAVLNSIVDPGVRNLPRGRGSIEQQTDNTHLLYDWPARRRLIGT